MLIFLAGLQAMPGELHEAAAIDGAGAFKRFRYITLPLLRPLIAVQLLFGVIYSAYQFSIPYVMFGSNPGPDADLMMTLIVRQSFSNNLFGFGSAVSTLLMLAMFVWVLIWYRAFKRDLEVGMTALTLTPRARKRMVNTGLDVLTYVVLLVMLSPVDLARGHLGAGRPRAVDRPLRPAAPDADRVQGHVGDDRLRALLPQQPDHLHRRPRCWQRRSPAPRATRSRASAFAARARCR